MNSRALVSPVRTSERPLTDLALVALALSDTAARWYPRPVDTNWHYAGVVDQSMVGFNPVSGNVYYGAVSSTAAWIATPNENPRLFNVKDRLVREVLFGVHDFLHNFAYRAIQQRRPALGFGSAPITRENFEDFAFLHLLTEAVATVGLDYWFLCAIDLNELLNIGTAVTSLTVSYALADECEYARFSPGFTAQTPDFLDTLCTFYCSGEFVGFGLEDATSSPVIMNWLSHEVAYGQRQRYYTRQWLEYLASDDLRLSEADLSRSVACDASWKRKLVEELSADLWSLVKESRNLYDGIALDERKWTCSRTRPFDFRFLNLFDVDLEEVAQQIGAGRLSAVSARFAFDQYLVSLDYHGMDPALRVVAGDLRKRSDLATATTLFRNAKRVPVPRIFARDIFLLA